MYPEVPSCSASVGGALQSDGHRVGRENGTSLKVVTACCLSFQSSLKTAHTPSFLLFEDV